MRKAVLTLAFAAGLLAPSPAQQARPAEPATRAQANLLLGQLDAAFNRASVDDYMRSFDDSRSVQHHAILRQRIARLLATGSRLADDSLKMRAASRIISFEPRGPIGIALVDTQIKKVGIDLTLRSYTVFRNVDGKPIGLFSILVDEFARAMHVKGNTFQCHACNYRISFDDGWLAVPVAPDRSGCMESLWLMCLEHDIHLEVAVHVGEEPLRAQEILESCARLAAKRGQTMKGEGFTGVDTWAPDCFDAQNPMPRDMTCGRCTQHCAGGHLAEMNVIAMGKLRYMIVVRGADETVKAHRKAIDAVLQSFTLIDPKLEAGELFRRAVRMHTGKGKFERGTYTNPTHRLAISGPENWQHTIRPGRYLFHLTFTCPTKQNTLHVRAYRPPRTTWTRQWVHRMVGDELNDARWHPADAAGFEWCEIQTAAHDVMRFAMRKDLLVVLQGSAESAKIAALIRTAMGSLATIE